MFIPVTPKYLMQKDFFLLHPDKPGTPYLIQPGQIHSPCKVLIQIRLQQISACPHAIALNGMAFAGSDLSLIHISPVFC